MYRKNVAGQYLFFAMVTTAGAADTGATVTVKLCIDNAAQASGGGTVTHMGSGQYKYAMAQADTNGNNISLFFTATGDVPVEKTIVTTAADPTDATRFGLTALPNAAAEGAGGLYTRGSGAGQINQNANGQVDTRWVAGNVTVGTNSDKTGYSLANAAISSATFSANAIDAAAIATDAIGSAELAQTAADKILATACTEPTAIVAKNPTAIAVLSWLLTLSRNRVEQTATTQTLRADDNTTAIATFAVSDDATTFVRAKGA